MLTLTENAQAAVRGLTEDVEQPSAGLRIASEQDQLAVSVVTQPQPTDVVIDADWISLLQDGLIVLPNHLVRVPEPRLHLIAADRVSSHRYEEPLALAAAHEHH